jgi:hypothetical protein
VFQVKVVQFFVVGEVVLSDVNLTSDGGSGTTYLDAFGVAVLSRLESPP